MPRTVIIDGDVVVYKVAESVADSYEVTTEEDDDFIYRNIGWADKEQNFMLDIRNLLNDTDFKLHSPANSLKSKMDWVNSLRFEIYTLQTKLDWDLRNITISYYNY